MNRLRSIPFPRPMLTACCGLLLAAACIATRAQPAPAMPSVESMPPAAPQTLDVGSATRSLFALQSTGIAASATPRPIPGSIAARSYERYLKSFDYPIPEKFGTTVRAQGSGSGTP